MSATCQFTGCTRPYHLPNVNPTKCNVFTIRHVLASFILYQDNWRILFQEKVLRKHMKTFHSTVGRVPLACDRLDVVLSQFELPGLAGRTQPYVKCLGSQDYPAESNYTTTRGRFSCSFSFLSFMVFNKFE